MITTDITTVVSVFTAVGALVVTAFGYVGYQKRRDRLATIRKTFDDVIGSLAADKEEQRLASAILLRRFFDETSELGLQTWLLPGRKAPYAQEAVSVIAAVLRGLETGNLQKLLADGLAYAPDLKGVDLQRTNLQNAYLRPRREDVTLERADFSRADLSGASLKNTSVTGGVFRKARLCQTVFKEADLRGANFFQADLTGAQFDEAKLKGASFKDARNVPEELLVFLDKDGIYKSDQPGPKWTSASAVKPGTSSIPRVFLSLLSHRTTEQQALVERFTRMLEEHGLIAEELPRSEYTQSGQLSEVRRRLSGCCGTAVFGFSQQDDKNALLPSTTESPPIQRHLTPTPWNYIEAGIAFALDLPLLVMSFAELDRGIFDRSIAEQSVYRLPLGSDWSAGPAKTALSDWTLAVFERASRGG